MKTVFSLIKLCSFVCLFGIISCSKEDNSGSPSELYGIWKEETYNNEPPYSSFMLEKGGEGVYTTWEPDDIADAHAGTEKPFSWSREKDVIILDFGFGYLKEYKIDYIIDNCMRLEPVSAELNFLSYKKWDLGGYDIPDYAMEIVGKYTIYSSTIIRSSNKLSLSLRADRTYSIMALDNDENDSGTYEVDHSRIRFHSNKEGMLDGRILFIVRVFSGAIYFEDEDNEPFEAWREK